MISGFVLAAWLAASIVPQTPARGVVVAGGGGGGITFSAAYGTVEGAFDAVTTIANVVVPADAVLILFAAHPGGGAETISSVVFNTSENFTLVQGKTDGSGGGGANNAAYILHNPTATTANVVVTWSAAGGSYEAAHVVVYTGVENDSGAAGCYRALTVANGSGGTGADASVGATSGDWIVSCVSNYDPAPAATLSADQTSRRTDLAIAGGIYDFATQDSNGPVGGTTSMTWTNDEHTTHIALALIPDS